MSTTLAGTSTLTANPANEGLDWGYIRPALKSIIASISGGLAAYWEDQPGEYIDPVMRASIHLKIGSIRSEGFDQIDQEFDVTKPLGEEYGDKVNTVTLFTLHVKCISYEQTDNNTAWTYLASIKNRLSRRPVKSAFRDVNCALIKTEELTDISGPIDGRQASIATFDLRLRASHSEHDPLRNGYIASIGLTGPSSP